MFNALPCDILGASEGPAFGKNWKYLSEASKSSSTLGMNPSQLCSNVESTEMRSFGSGIKYYLKP